MTFALLVKHSCPYCKKAKRLLDIYKMPYYEHEITTEEWNKLYSDTKQSTVPYVFNSHNDLIGGYNELKKWIDLEFPVDYYHTEDLMIISERYHKKLHVEYNYFLYSFLKCVRNTVLTENDYLQKMGPFDTTIDACRDSGGGAGGCCL